MDNTCETCSKKAEGHKCADCGHESEEKMAKCESCGGERHMAKCAECNEAEENCTCPVIQKG